MPPVANPILDGKLSIGQAQTSVRFSVVDRWLDPIGEIRPLSASSVTVDAESTIKRKLTGVVISEATLRDVNPYTDMIRPWFVLGDGNEFPLGVFAFTDLPKKVSTFMSTMDATMLDQTWMLDQQAARRYSLPPQGRWLDVVHSILDSVGIADKNRVLPSDNDSRAFEAVGWTEVTHKIKIIDECAQMMGCLPSYFDNQGRFVIRAFPDMRRVSPDVSYQFRNSRILAESIVTNDRLLASPNLYRVVGSGVASGDIVGEARVDPDLPWSIEKRGWELAHVEEMQGLSSTGQAEQIAQSLAAANSGFQTLEFDSFPDPRHDVFTLAEVDGIMWRELGWNLGLPVGPMGHKLTSGGFPVGG